MIRAFTRGPFTGRHISAILVAFFGVVIAVNLAMARYAASTFGGVVVENSYVASQQFNGWLNEAAREKAMGWKASVERLPDGRVAVSLAGAPARGVSLSAEAWHPLGRMPDQPLRFVAQGSGRFISDRALPAGRWRLRLAAAEGAQRWRDELDLR